MSRFVTTSKQIIKYIEREAPLVAKGTARDVLNKSNDLIPQPGVGRGYAKGPLQASGHVIGDDGDTSDFYAAVSRAASMDGGRLSRRRQIQFVPHAPLKRADQTHWRICYPVLYASALHDGFYHVKANKFIIGTAYLVSAMSVYERKYFKEMGLVLFGTSSIAAKLVQRKSAAEIEADRRERLTRELQSAGGREFREWQINQAQARRAAGRDITEETAHMTPEQAEAHARRAGYKAVDWDDEARRKARKDKAERAYQRGTQAARQATLLLEIQMRNDKRK